MSNVNMTVNVDGDGSGGACCAGLTHQVRVFYSELADGKVSGPFTVEKAQDAACVALARDAVVRVAVEPAGS